MPRDALGRWLPGTSPNPSGRRKGAAGLARVIQEASRQGEELVEFLFRVFRDEDAEPQARQWACRELLDRGFGKSVTAVEVAPVEPESFNPRLLTDDELETFRELASKAEATLPPGDDVEPS